MLVADLRNFRSSYYEKVGFKNVEEKKMLEILLKEKILDRNKLQQFCIRCTVPAAFRSLVWKICLGVLSVHTECHAFILDQRKQEYSDLIQALSVMRIIDNNTPKKKILYGVFLLQTDSLRLINPLEISNGFCDIVQFLMPYCKDDLDLYLLAKGFYCQIHTFDHEFPKLVEAIKNFLEREEPILYKHLKSIDALDNLPYEACFNSCFAKIMNFSGLARIWDKLCGGSYTIFFYTFISLLMHLKPSFLKNNTNIQVLENINKITEDDAEIIFTRAIHMWNQHGGNLAVHEKLKS